MIRCDLLIVGGGIVGTCAALHAAESGAVVHLVDGGTNAGSDANAGSLHVQLQSRFIRLFPEKAPNVEASLPLYLQAVTLWDLLEARFGPFQMVRDGGLMLAETAEQLRFLETKAGREARHGLNVEILDRPALDRLAPWLGPQILGAELCRDEGKLNPLHANIRLKAAARAAGVMFYTDTVTTLTPDGTGMLATGSAHGATWRAEQVIVANGWGAGALCGPLGLSVPVQAEALHMNITEDGDSDIRHLIQHAERSITLKQLKTGQIVIGGGWPAHGRGAQVPQVVAQSLLGNVALAGRLVPAIAGLRVLRSWAGINTTADGRTILGRLPDCPRVIVAVPGDAGYTLGPLVGHAAAALSAGSLPNVQFNGCGPERFAA
ncbi:NAD(P)/FAD-dependent oxidoreductase [Roseicitreum antarcticum]|uniref:Glycine/D-amino acid oxidase n=1 Tax=Roseicitreum antarcticum TaxID=564137 RepID=A0A1H2YY08_9RHOB|nr:FAD-dependent oxidoreductase [Roseicitreum antarcticum]SDX10072.1 Glycine/D-amino acid oxidase [Roseicitreum antarcticum]